VSAPDCANTPVAETDNINRNIMDKIAYVRLCSIRVVSLVNELSKWGEALTLCGNLTLGASLRRENA
jgi:hypothetical protein